MKKLLSLFTALLLCTAMWSANLIAPGTYSGTWKLNVMPNIAGRTIASSNIVVEAEMDGKQTITFNNFKLPYTSALETTIQLILSTSDKKITIASQNVGYNNGTYPVSIVTHDSYKSASLYDPATGVLTFGVKYVYTKNSTTYTFGNAFEYIELQLNDKWSEWEAFPSEEKNTAHWTINGETNPYWKDSAETKVPAPEVKLYVRTSKTENAVKQIKVENFNLGIKDAKNADIILDWNCSTNSISLTDQVLNSYYTYKSGSSNYANLAKAKTAEDGSIDIKTGELTLPLQYLKEGSRYSVNETLQLQDYEMPYSGWEDFSPFGLSKGNYYVSANKNTWHENLNIQVRECTLDAQYRQIKVQDWNYSDIASCKMDLIIDWNSKTNKCTIAKKSTGYAINGKTIYIKTRKDTEGTYSDGVFVFPILYATTEKTISNTTDDTLRMQKPVKSITFDNKEYTLASVEDNKIITPTVAPDDATNKSVTYTSSNSDVATVDNGENAGKIHFISAGETTITATAKDGSGVSGSYKLTTFVLVTGITLDKTSVDLCPNSDVTLTATVEPSNATTQTVKWTSNKEDVVKVGENGKLQFVGIGSAIITASATDDSNISSSCEVSTYRISLANPGYGTEYIVPVKGGKAYFKDVPSRSQLQFVLEGKDYAINDWKISRTNLSWITPSIGFDKQSNKVLFSFSAADSTLTPRAGSFSVEAYDYKFDGYTISQEAPTFKAKEGYPDTTQTLYLPFNSDDTVCVYNESTQEYDKVSEIYIESEVTLNNTTISVKSKKGLTRIWKYFYNDNGHSVCIRLTREDKQYVMEDTKDTVTISFLGNPENKYEYTILHKGAGKLTTNHNYRTIVFGPKANRNGLFINDKGELPGTNYIAIRAQIPLQGNIYYKSDLAKDDRFYNPNLSIKKEGTDDEYLQVLPSTLSDTDVKLEDKLYILIPNVDTVAIHLIQEPTPRVWQLFGDVYTEMEVGNKGGKARFKGYTDTEMTLYSNTSVTADEISFTYTNETDKEWVHPSAVIKPCSKLTKDTVILTFNVDPWNGIESRSTNITITVQGKDFVIPLTQKTFGITLSHQGDIDTLVVPVAGGKALWKGTNHPDLYVEGTEAYGDNLLQVTYPDGVEITRQASMYNTGRKRTTFTFSKTGTVTEDWSDSIFISFDSINDAEHFEYHFKDTIIITQAAPTLTPEKGMDHDQAFTFLAAGDDTLLINGTKTAKIYLYSEVKLSSDNIAVKSKHGLVNISGGYGSTSNFICLTLTRKQCIQEDAKDTVVVYFTDKPEIRYEYYITQAGTGKLTTSHDYRTLVFGPKANRRGRFVNESGNLLGTNYITIRAAIPVEKISCQSDLAEENRFYDLDTSIKNLGTDEEYLQIFPKTLSNTDVLLEDNVYFFIPNVDTITLHLIQEAKARVWQYRADRDTALEVNNKGGKARFKGYTITEMTLVSNTPIEENEVNVTCANWITPNSVINASKDTVRITFTVGEYTGNESRTDTMTITIQDNEFRMPLTQKVFSVEWNNGNNNEELVVPVAGGTATWKGSEDTELYVYGTEAYRDALLKVTKTEGVEITRQTVKLNTGRQRTTFTFSKTGTVTEDWIGEITISLDSTNTEGFEYHFSKTFTITQAAPEPTAYTRPVTSGNWGTICLPYAAASFSGAEMYSIAGKMEDDKGIYLDQVNEMEAGKPYIFKATATAEEIKVVYAAGEAKEAQTVNGLCGYIGDDDLPVLENAGNYIVYDNALYYVNSENVTIASNRAYIKYSEVGTTPSPAPQVRRVAMPINGAPANMLQVNDTKQPVKVLRGGHIVILRADKEYDILGQSK